MENGGLCYHSLTLFLPHLYSVWAKPTTEKELLAWSYYVSDYIVMLLRTSGMTLVAEPFLGLLDLRKLRRSLLAMYGRMIIGNVSWVSKHTSTSRRTLGWLKSSIIADSAMKSSTSSGLEAPVLNETSPQFQFMSRRHYIIISLNALTQLPMFGNMCCKNVPSPGLVLEPWL